MSQVKEKVFTLKIANMSHEFIVINILLRTKQKLHKSNLRYLF